MAQGLALGCSLVGKTQYPCILLHTKDVPTQHLSVLRRFWETRCVAEIVASARLTAGATDFKKIFSKLHIFNTDILPYDRVLYLDLDTLVTAPHCVDDVLESGHTLAAVGCPTGYRMLGTERKKKLMRSTPEGQWLKPGDTFNGGVMLVSPHRDVFKILTSDCQAESTWHYPTTYPESHYLKWVANWRSLSPSLNLCPRMGKGQANTREWQDLPWQQVEIFHFSTQSKPYYWFKQGTIESLSSSADKFPEELSRAAEVRAQVAFHIWLSHLAVALLLVAIRENTVLQRNTVVICLLTGDWAMFTKLLKKVFRHFVMT